MPLPWLYLLTGLIIGMLLTLAVGRLVAWWVVRADKPYAGKNTLAPVSQIKRLRWLLARQAEMHAETDTRYETVLQEFREAYEIRAGELDTLRTDVRDAVLKTRELREELIDRATEEARLKVLARSSNE